MSAKAALRACMQPVQGAKNGAGAGVAPVRAKAVIGEG